MPYFIIEGMPGSGKSSVSKKISEKLNAIYMKSLVSDTTFGDVLKEIRNQNENIFLELLYSSDLLLDELRVYNYMQANKSVVRDKSIISSIAHLKAQGCAIQEKSLKKAWLAMRNEMTRYCATPTKVIIMNPSFEIVIERSQNKRDCSLWDRRLFDNRILYEAQANALIQAACALYGENSVLELKSDSLSLEECVEYIIDNLQLPS